MTFIEALFAVLSLFVHTDVFAAPQENQLLNCIFSRASNLSDWEQLSNDIAKDAVNVTPGLEPVDPVSVQCRQPNARCVAIWAVRQNATDMLLQGCWDVAQDKCSGPDACSSGDRMFQRSRNGHPSYMCCCLENNCNHIDRVVVGPFKRRRHPSAEELRGGSAGALLRRDTWLSTLLWCSSLLSVLVLLLAMKRFWVSRQRWAKRKSLEIRTCSTPSSEYTAATASKTLTPKCSGASDREPLLEVDPFVASLQLGERIGGGHFAVVHRASSNKGDVAVKVYHSDQATFDNEYEILNLLQPLKHPNIIQLIRRVVTGNRLVLQLYSSSLHSLLDERPLTLTEFFDCALAVNDGLAFLHSHTNGTVSKPVIAHRDLNPNNVLVSRTSNPSRLQLCIADFGLSVSFPEGRPTKDLELITERGTVRYMAGELIEGSVNLLDPMTSLLQTDVYSCALVMWEMLWRCRNVWPLGETPSHRVAFDNVVPRNPRLEHMYTVVVRERQRPDMPPSILKQRSFPNRTDLVELWSYISDMWEHEPEGRTTAACTADRLRRLRASMDPAGLETVS